MDVHIHSAGEHRVAPGIDLAAAAHAPADLDDPAICHSDIADRDRAGGNHDAIPDDQVHHLPPRDKGFLPQPPNPLSMPEVRLKVITVIFADLVGSTGLTERLDPEEAREVVGRFYATVQQAFERFEGTVANLLGDAVLAAFGLPVAHEDDPERAVRAGLVMRDAMASPERAPGCRVRR